MMSAARREAVSALGTTELRFEKAGREERAQYPGELRPAFVPVNMTSRGSEIELLSCHLCIAKPLPLAAATCVLAKSSPSQLQQRGTDTVHQGSKTPKLILRSPCSEQIDTLLFLDN